MRPCPKEVSFRSQALRDLAKEAPICFCCLHVNDGTVVGAHSNAIDDNHVKGQKAHDLLAYVCASCHHGIDSTWKSGGREEFYRAVYKTTVWLLKEGYLKVMKTP